MDNIPTLQEINLENDIKRRIVIDGWYQAENSKRFHYFLNGFPACGAKIRKTTTPLFPFGSRLQDHVPSRFTGDCPACMARLKKVNNG